MPSFWENIVRFPRFFISSILGLILTIMGPFLNLLKRPETTTLLIVILIGIIGFLSITLKAMLDI